MEVLYLLQIMLLKSEVVNTQRAWKTASNDSLHKHNTVYSHKHTR